MTTSVDAKGAYLVHVEAEKSRQSLYMARNAMKMLPMRFTKAALRDWRKQLVGACQKGEYSPETVNRYISELRSFLHFCRREDFFEVSRDTISDQLRYVKTIEKVPTYMQPSEIGALLKQMVAPGGYKRRDKMLYVAMGLFLGARPGEILLLEGKDIRLETREVIVKAPKTGRMRRAPFDDSVTLKRLMPLLAGVKGKLVGLKPRAVWFRKLAEELDLPATDKNLLRRTSACYAASSGCYTQYELSEKYGHSMEVARRFYLVPIRGLQGDRMETWMQCNSEAETFMDALQAEVEAQ